MTWKVLLADDEYFIRQRIKKIIPWDELNLEFAGEAENGQKVLSLLTTETFHIILLDIRMPKMTGMDVASYIHEHYPDIKIIILSGYNEFEYARSAMRCGVIDYLLKPVNADDLKKTLLKCREQLKKEETRKIQEEKLTHYEKTLALSQVLYGGMTFPNFIASNPDFSIFSYSRFLGVYFIENGSALLSELSRLLEKKDLFHTSFQDSDTKYIIQIFWREKEEPDRLLSLLKRFQYQYPSTFLYLGQPFLITLPWKSFYKKISHGILLRYFCPSMRVVLEPLNPHTSDSVIDFHLIRTNMITIFNNHKETEFKDYIQRLFLKIKESGNPAHLHLAVSELILTYTLYEEGSGDASRMTRDMIHSILDEETSMTSLEQTMISYGLSCLCRDKASPSEITVSNKIIDYITHHYQDSNLSVSLLADIFGMNMSYMGSLFKKVNNQSILQYITSIRMEQAKKLLENNQYRVFEVADKVGYSDVFYFSRRFKKCFGCAPKEYAGLHL